MYKDKLAHSLKWVFSTTIIKRVLSMLLLLYVLRVFDRSDIGVYKAFVTIISISSVLATFSFNYLIIIEKNKIFFKYGIRFILLASIIISFVLFFLKDILATKYGSETLYLYILYGFWLVIPLAVKNIIKSLYELDMNFKFISIAETIHVFSFVIIAMLLFLYDLKFYYYVLAFYLGELVEVCILFWGKIPKSSINLNGFLSIFKKTKTPSRQDFKFLSLTTAPTVLNMFIFDAPVIIMGLFFLPYYYGTYTVAASLVVIPTSFITLSLYRVLLPTFSLTDIDKLKNKVLNYVKHVILIIWLPILIFGILLKNFAYLIVGTQEISLVVSIISVLIIRSLISLILNPISTIPTILKKPHYELYWSVCTMAIVCATIYLLRGSSFLNMVYAFVFIYIGFMLFYILLILKMVDASVKMFFKYLMQAILYFFPLIITLFFPNEFNKLWLVIAVLYSLFMLYKFESKFLIDTLHRFKNRNVRVCRDP